MSEKTAIGWTDHTFNPWWGCQRVSDGCTNCYAEAFARRTGHSIWGPTNHSPRRMFGDAHWREPLKWNEMAKAEGRRHRVFCASMADVFEAHDDVVDARARLWPLIEETPWLDWQLLTKRPQNIRALIPVPWLVYPRPNVWFGTSVEHQAAADARIPHLLAVPAAVRFLSCEPLLGPVDLTVTKLPTGGTCDPRKVQEGRYPLSGFLGPISWITVGGESGPGHREMDLSWLASLIRQCQESGLAVFVKQDSGQYPGRDGRIPADLLIREFPTPVAVGVTA